jgi:hypothetical protein
MSELITFHYGLSDLPNTEGFRFRGWLHDGELIPCVVAKNAMGMHFAVTEDGRRPIYDQLKGWTAYMRPHASQR